METNLQLQLMALHELKLAYRQAMKEGASLTVLLEIKQRLDLMKELCLVDLETVFKKVG
jgi:hypothetical protein